MNASEAEAVRELLRLERRWAYGQSIVTSLEQALLLQRKQLEEIDAEIAHCQSVRARASLELSL